MKTDPIALSILVTLLSLPVSLTAQRPGGGPGRGGFHPLHPVEQAIDANGNGLLSRDEIKNAGRSLLRLDANEDGRLTSNEFGPGGPGPDAPRIRSPKGGTTNPGPPPHPLTRALDTNQNEILTGSELEAAEKSLLTLDVNGDGTIGEDEMHPHGRHEGPQNRGPGPDFGALGEPRREFGFAPEMESQSSINFEAVRRVMALDQDRDKRVSRAELPADLTDLMRADTNRDGFITRGEARDFVERLRPSETGTAVRRKRGF